MSTNKSCTNCPGATDHDTAHCPLFLLRERFRANEELPPKWFALVLQELDAFTTELRGKRPEQAGGAQGEREVLPYWEPCNPACDPELNGFRDRQCHCAQARAALAQPSPEPDHFTHADKKLEALLNATALVIESPGHDAAHYWAECMREYDEAHSPAPELERPEVVAWQYRVTAGQQTGWSLWHPGKGEEFERSYTVERRSLMTVTQHDRIVGALRRQVSALALGAEQAMEQRDAAPARVAELESQLLDVSAERNAIQRQRDTAQNLFERECDDADELIRLMGLDPEQFRTDGGSINLPKLRAAIAPVTQAGQVPEEVRILLARAQGQIEHLAECTENLGEDLDDDDVSEDVAEARGVAEEIGAYLAVATARGE